MKIALLCDIGAETPCAQEAKQYGANILEKYQGIVLAEAEQKTAAKIAYYGLTILDILQVITEKTVSEEQNNLQPYTAKTFAVRAQGKNSQEINLKWGAKIKEQTDMTVDLTNPDLLYIALEEHNILGISLTKRDLKKREYRVFTSNKSLRSTLAAATIYFSGYTGKENILLPMENDGTLAIETAFIASTTSPHQYQPELAIFTYLPDTKEIRQDPKETTQPIHAAVQSVQHLKAIQKNAKIAGVHKLLAVTKADVDWLDTRYDEKSLDIIVANPPSSGKKKEAKEVQLMMEELAQQAEYILKKTGTITILSIKPEEHLPALLNKGFKIKTEQEVFMGEQKLQLTKLSR